MSTGLVAVKAQVRSPPSEFLIFEIFELFSFGDPSSNQGKGILDLTIFLALKAQ